MAKAARVTAPIELRPLLIEVAEVQPPIYWESQVRLACPSANGMPR